MHKIVLPKFSENIFKAYDIRGKYQEEINEDAAYKIARSYAMYLGLGSRGKRLDIVVSFDDRPSSPALKKAFIEGLLDEGTNVVDVGLTTTPMHYFIVNKTDADGGAMITASHLPFEYNGIKLSKKGAEILGGGNGLEEIRNSALRGVFLNKSQRGIVIEKNFKNDYLNFFEEKFSALKNYEIKINANLENTIVEIFFRDLIARFPKFKINSKKYDFGISFDRDGDRIKFSDEHGKEIAGDIITALLIRRFKEDFNNHSHLFEADIHSPKGEHVSSLSPSLTVRGWGIRQLTEGGELPIVYSINSSRIVKEEIEKYGGKAIESRVGHSFMKKAMRQNDAIFGGELSGHYYFKDFFYCDSAIFTMFCIVDLLREQQKTLSELIGPLQKYYSTPELNFKVANKELYIDKAAAAFSDGKISYLDGIKIDYSDPENNGTGWWFLLRPSNTEDLIRLRIEADTPELLEEKKKQILTLLNLST